MLYYSLYWNSLQWLSSVTGDETGLTSQMISTPSLRTQSMKGCTTLPRSTSPTLYEQHCVFFYVPKESEQWKACGTGPSGFHPYLRRLEWLTICRCHNKGSTFSGWGSNPWPPARQTGTYIIELTGWRLVMIELLLSSSCRVSMLQTASYNKNDSLSFKCYSKNPWLRTWVLRTCYNNLFSLFFCNTFLFLKSLTKKVLYPWANKISKHSGSSLET